jgi:hypothetical protein
MSLMGVKLMKSYHHELKEKLEHTMIKEQFIQKKNLKIIKKYFLKPPGKHSNKILESFLILNHNHRNTYTISFSVIVLVIYWIRN